MTRRSGRRIGHKGADHIAPGNTLASFDAALAHGCDMVEFDVLPEHDGPAASTAASSWPTTSRTPPGATPLTLEEGLDHLAGAAFDGIELDVDLKLPGYEERVIAALRERGMEPRTLISTMEVVSLPVLRAPSRDGPDRLVGARRPSATTSPSGDQAAGAGDRPGRCAGPSRARSRARCAPGEIDAVMSHWRARHAALRPRACARAGGELYVWTVDDAQRIRRFERWASPASSPTTRACSTLPLGPGSSRDALGGAERPRGRRRRCPVPGLACACALAHDLLASRHSNVHDAAQAVGLARRAAA